MRSNENPTALQSFLMDWRGSDSLSVSGYTRLIDCPEVQTAIDSIANLVSEMTIRLFENTDNGDIRIRDELARKIDVAPYSLGTRKTFVQWIVQTMLGAGDGNAYVLPVTKNGLIEDLVPLPPSKVSVIENADSYKIVYNGVAFQPDEIMHFVLDPDPEKPWMGRGYRVQLKDVTKNLKQAAVTKNGFMSSKWKPSIIVKVDGLTDAFSSPSGRQRLLDEYIKSDEAGAPWVIPSEFLEIQQVKPLSLSDLALNDSVTADKKAIAAILGVPPYIVGAGSFSKDEHNAFVRTKVMPIATTITQTLTRNLLMSPKRYFKMNPRSLYAYDLKELAEVADNQYVRGVMTGNEVRDWLGLSPMDGLDELVMLENYIPAGMIGDQKKLIQDAGQQDV